MAKDKADIKRMIEELKALDTKRMYLNDFFHTWKESDDEISAVFHVAEILRGLRENNISAKVFDSGLGISIFRDNSTRTRFSFASALFYLFPYFPFSTPFLLSGDLHPATPANANISTIQFFAKTQRQAPGFLCRNTLWALRASFKIRHLRRLSRGSADPREHSRS